MRVPFVLHNIAIDPPYRKQREITLNQWGIEKKEIYRASDIFKILSITTSLYYFRERKGYYPKVRRQGRYRVFTEADIERLVEITKNCKSFLKKAPS